jgi:hypothetical protein
VDAASLRSSRRNGPQSKRIRDTSSLSGTDNAGWFDQRVKHDDRDRAKRPSTEPACFASEPIFIPHPDAVDL